MLQNGSNRDFLGDYKGKLYITKGSSRPRKQFFESSTLCFFVRSSTRAKVVLVLGLRL